MTHGRKIERLPDLFGGYKLDPGAIGYILDEMVKSLERLGFERGIELAEQARELQQVALQKEYAWDQQENGDPLAREGVNELDDQIDRTLSNLLKGLKTFADFPEGSEKHRLANELIEEFFPKGVFPITSKKYINQQAHVSTLVDQLRETHLEELETLGFAELVDKLDELNAEFGERLNPDYDDVSYDEVREARDAAEDAFYEFFVAVLGEYGDDLETLNEVIAPYLEVNARLSRHMSRGKAKPPVDPETGEPVDPTSDDDEGE